MIHLSPANPLWSTCIADGIEVSFLGFFEIDGQLILSGKDLKSVIVVHAAHMDIWDYLCRQLLARARGNFAFMIKKENTVYAAVDIIRSSPLFIEKENGDFYVRDNISRLASRSDIDQDSSEEFLVSGAVFGDRTVYKHVKALQAGEVVKIENGEIESKRYFKFEYDKNIINLKSEERIAGELDIVLSNIFKRMIRSCPNVNNWIVPLSGGYDSRTIVNYLHKLGAKNVICFSYGIPGNPQSSLSRKVASALGYPWHFLEYSERLWHELHSGGVLDQYINYAFNGSSFPHLQDFLAVYLLKNKRIINEDDVFIPGHAFEILCGSHLNKDIISLTRRAGAVEFTAKRYTGLWRHKKISSGITRSIQKIYDAEGLKPSAFPEFFNWQERQVKFIANSVRVYEFFGFRWRLPYWDREAADFWMRVDFPRRLRRRFFCKVATKYLFEPELCGIPFFGKPARSWARKVFNCIPNDFKILVIRLLKRKTFVNEALNQVFSFKAEDIGELIAPLDAFPENLKKYVKPHLKRYLYQYGFHGLLTLYTIKNEALKKVSANEHNHCGRGAA